MARAPKVYPLLNYSDPGAAVEWLSRVFGFRTDFVNSHEGSVKIAQLRLGDDIVMISRGKPGVVPQQHCICIAMEDLEGCFERARAAGAEMIAELQKTQWGGTLFTCKDPEGHTWSVGDYWGEPLPQ